jgi:drug/metabolite transporter (DMT)-like permease
VGVALLAALLFGVSAPVAKLLLRDTTPQLLAGLLYLGSGVGLSLFKIARRDPRDAREAPLNKCDLPWLAGAILFGGGIGPVLLMVGLTRTPASSASLLLNMEGAFTALLAWYVFHENFDRRIALGMLAIVAGGVALSWEGAIRWGGIAGPAAVAAACLCWAIDNNLTQKVSAGDPVQVAMLKGLTAGSVNTVLALSLGAQWPDGLRVAAALGLGFLSYGVSLTLFVLALRHLGTARTGAYFAAAPFVGAAVAIVMFRDPVTGFFLAGATLMGLGVWLHLSEHHEHEHTHDGMQHTHAHVHDDHHRHGHGPADPQVTDPRPHTHPHRHQRLTHTHTHYPDIHHRHLH